MAAEVVTSWAIALSAGLGRGVGDDVVVPTTARSCKSTEFEQDGAPSLVRHRHYRKNEPSSGSGLRNRLGRRWTVGLGPVRVGGGGSVRSGGGSGRSVGGLGVISHAEAGGGLVELRSVRCRGSNTVVGVGTCLSTCRLPAARNHVTWEGHRLPTWRHVDRVTCGPSDDEARKAAQKALEEALAGKKIKWADEGKDEGGGGDGSRGGGGGGGGGGWGWGGSGGGGRSGIGPGGGGFSEAMDEFKQVVLAICGMTVLYFVFTKWRSIMAFFMSCLIFALRGFKRTSRDEVKFAVSSGSRAKSGADGPGATESEVMRKWGSN
ncbi:hypothetical protein CBR_g49335 [Chara braunii]|uniref:Uncharacterized protein n=1 Tax=Chara braunii TaxID=69332 RepID=A0A388M4W3_CHABU|nr:hypothetical protein CBR_g49335 [Chara braunii]|eukprot:GBG89545.1 hypothetical protein CBR_g49335 [Chara braunii]